MDDNFFALGILILIVVGVGLFWSVLSPTTSPDSLEGIVTVHLASLEEGVRGHIKVDKIEWYTGAQAIAEYRKDHQCEDPECLPPNNIYIRNDSRTLEKYPITSDVHIVMQTLSHDASGNYNFNQEVTYKVFKGIFDEKGDIRKEFELIPFHLTFKNGEITEIKEQYVP